eukprot:Phypoly_transcript_08924.p1 GENE.Phypoly_transcript_08924~~Phypoly_transcript_08924.p1  ORF type:complete len:331 (+),score=24.92 Phypoly_transcript_08924:82-1074(+)
MTTLLVLLSLFYLSLATGAYVQLHTGRGAIEAIRSTSISGKLLENTFCFSCEEQFWELVKDSRFPNGVFIRSKAFPDLVWDSQGNQATNGNPIILYKQHDTLDTTKNQRWANTTHGQLAVEMNVNYVAKVNDYATLVLSPKSSLSSYQLFTAVSASNFANVTIINTENRPIIVGFTTSAGEFSGYQNYHDTQSYIVPLGSRISILDDNEMPVYGDTITSLKTEITIPIPVSYLPLGTHHYSGQLYTEGSSLSVSITFNNQQLTGSGQDSGRGSFTIDGSYELGGHMDFQMDYGGDWQLNRDCIGQVGDDGVTIDGLCDGMSPYNIVMDDQ